MSIEVMSKLFKRRLGSDSRKLIALRLADFADDEGRGIWPTVSRLAAECEVSVRTIQRTLADFVEEGLLVVVAKGGGAPGSSTRYDFVMPAVERLPKLGEKAVSTGDTLSPVSTDVTGVTGDERGDIDDGEGCHRDGGTIIEPPIDPPVERERERDHEKPGTRPVDLDVGFDVFFSTWLAAEPKHSSDLRAPALSVWRKLSADERGTASTRTAITEHLERQRLGGRKAFPSARTYLAEKLWQRGAPAKADPGQRMAVAPWSRSWWVVWHRRAMAGNRSACNNMANFARQGQAYGLPLAEMPGEAEEAALFAALVKSQTVQQWVDWYRARGLVMPRPDRAEWIFLPAAEPATQAAE